MKKLITSAVRGLGNVVALALQAIDTGGDSPVSVLDADGVPVAWRLFGFGPFSITRDGLTYAGEFTEEHAAQILAYHKAKGNKIPVDSEHYLYRLSERLGLSEADVVAVLMDKRAAMAFGRLETREDGLWIVDVEWSDTAHAIMAEDLFRWFSPVVRGLVDGNLRITSVAMTNSPALDQLGSIAASAESANVEEWATVALSDLGRAIQPEHKGEQKGMKNLLALLGAMIGMTDAIALSDGEEFPADVMEKLQGIATELPLLRAAKETGDTFLAAARDALSLSDDDGLNEVQGALLGLVEKAKNADELKTRMDALELSAETATREKVVAGGLASGKLTKALLESDWGKSQDSAALSAFLQHAPVIVPPGKATETRDLPDPDTVALTAEDRKVCAELGIDEEKFLEEKKKETAV